MGFSNKNFITAEAVAWRCSVKNVFLKILQDPQNFRRISHSFFFGHLSFKTSASGATILLLPIFLLKVFPRTSFNQGHNT